MHVVCTLEHLSEESFGHADAEWLQCHVIKELTTADILESNCGNRGLFSCNIVRLYSFLLEIVHAHNVVLVEIADDLHFFLEQISSSLVVRGVGKVKDFKSHFATVNFIFC